MIQHLEGDCRDVLATLPAQSIHCAVTSPPYFGLRSYLANDHPAKSREIGQEKTVKEYIDNLVAAFRQVSRVLMNDGTLWLNLGDTYAKNSLKSARRAGVKPGELIGVPWRYAGLNVMQS
jgi:DNA modification methylase